LDALYRPVVGKPFVLEDLCLDMGTFVASALTAETVFEIIKCICDVDMPARGRMGSKFANFQIFQFWVCPRWKYFDFWTLGIQSNSEHVD